MATSAFLGDALAGSTAGTADTLRRVTVLVRTGRDPGRSAGAGAGVVWGAAGTIVTNAHVARGPVATIETHAGERLAARVVQRDEARDLAELRVEGLALPGAVVGDSDALRPGQIVLALGHPLGVSNVLTLGVVHSVGAHPTALPGDRRRWVQADVRLAPGNSGGPLADANGRVVGVNSMIARGLGLAVPSRAVTRFLHGASERPRLGVTTRPALVRDSARTAALGLVVVHVEGGGSAEDAGVQVGDVVVGAAGRGFVHPGELAALVADATVGDRVALELLRGGRRHEREVTLRATRGPATRAA